MTGREITILNLKKRHRELSGALSEHGIQAPTYLGEEDQVTDATWYLLVRFCQRMLKDLGGSTRPGYVSDLVS